MQLDNFYNSMVDTFVSVINNTFKNQMETIKIIRAFEQGGYFRLEYFYMPKKYTIIIENELRGFDITITDENKASNSLYRITRFENELNKRHIKTSISLLKHVLLKNDFDMYLHKDGKLYKKNNEGIKRVKDIRKL